MKRIKEAFAVLFGRTSLDAQYAMGLQTGIILANAFASVGKKAEILPTLTHKRDDNGEVN